MMKCSERFPAVMDTFTKKNSKNVYVATSQSTIMSQHPASFDQPSNIELAENNTHSFLTPVQNIYLK